MNNDILLSGWTAIKAIGSFLLLLILKEWVKPHITKFVDAMNKLGTNLLPNRLSLVLPHLSFVLSWLVHLGVAFCIIYLATFSAVKQTKTASDRQIAQMQKESDKRIAQITREMEKVKADLAETLAAPVDKILFNNGTILQSMPEGMLLQGAPGKDVY